MDEQTFNKEMQKVIDGVRQDSSKFTDPNLIVALVSMGLDLAYKLYTQKSQTMTPAELDAWLINKEQSVSDLWAQIEAL